jgi:hypothetical protein
MGHDGPPQSAQWPQGTYRGAVLPLARLKAQLVPQGYVIHASEVLYGTRVVVFLDHDGMVRSSGVIELRPTSLEASRPMNGSPVQGKEPLA